MLLRKVFNMERSKGNFVRSNLKQLVLLLKMYLNQKVSLMH